MFDIILSIVGTYIYSIEYVDRYNANCYLLVFQSTTNEHYAIDKRLVVSKGFQSIIQVDGK